MDGDGCGCCAGLRVETPREVWNRPGLPAVGYRVGAHGSFKASMLARLSAPDYPALHGLTTRDDADLSIALLDAMAVLGDILTFYNERVANESYLRTAVQRRSLAAKGRLTGYEPAPGLSAQAALAFTLEDGAGAPEQSLVPAGTQVQSIPAAGALPQVFETAADLIGRPEWNAMRPVLRHAHPMPDAGTHSITVVGAATGAQRGELILIAGGTAPLVRQVTAVTPDPASGTTRIDFDPVADTAPPYTPPDLPPVVQFDFGVAPLTTGAVAGVLGFRWQLADLHAYVATKRWSFRQLRAAAAVLADPAPPAAGVFRFRQTAAVFGHNAPRLETLPTDIQGKATEWDKVVAANQPWEGLNPAAEPGSTVQLDRTYSGVGEGSWAVLAQADPDTGQPVAAPYPVAAVSELSVAAFMLTGKVTQLNLGLSGPSGFTRRGTTVHLDSQALTLAALPVPGPLTGSTILLDGLFLGLAVGQLVAVSGQRDDLSGATETEVVTITAAEAVGAATCLTVSPPLQGSYVRDTVAVNANVALATHGQTRQDTLGSGDSGTVFQVMVLSQPPLAFVADPGGGGPRSTLQVRVNGVLWSEVPSLLDAGPHDRAFVTWQGDDGAARVGFGDGVTGARLPTGAGNVTAQYRQGTGTAGLVGAGALSLLLTRPSGVRSVSNPLPSAGAADAEGADSLRQTAPLHVLTLDRVVSVADYANLARAYPGIAKAAVREGLGPRGRAVVLTLAGAGGAALDPADSIVTSLLARLRTVGDPTVTPLLGRYVPVFFRVGGLIRTDPALPAGAVAAAVEAALRAAFSVDRREFGQPVWRSEVVAEIQAVPGVLAFDLVALSRVGAAEAPDPLPAAMPPPGASPDVPAELLLLDPRPVVFGTMPGGTP